MHGGDFRDNRLPSADSEAINTDLEFQRKQVVLDLEPRC